MSYAYWFFSLAVPTLHSLAVPHLHSEPYEIGSSTSKEYLRRPNMMVVVIYVYMRVYRDPVMTVASLLVFYIQKQYDGDGYVAI